MDSRQVDDEARIRHKHQALLQEYLALQKEFVSKKRKLQEAKQRKEILLEEVRFLRRRCKLLLKNQTQMLEKDQEFVQPQNRDAEFKARAKEICYSVSVAQLQNPRPTMDALWNPGCEEKKSRKRKGVMQRAKAGKKSKDLCSDEGKKTQGTSNSVEKGKFQGKIS